MKDSNFRNGDAKTAIFGSEVMLTPSPVDKIPDGPTTPEIAYQMVRRDFRTNTASLEPSYIRYYVYGRVRDKIDERGYQHQLY